MKFENLDTRSGTRVTDIDTGNDAADHAIDAHAPRVITGDCLQVMRGLPEASVDAVVTSPPYNIGLNYGSYHDNLAREAYLDWMGQVAAEIVRLLKSDGSLFLNLGTTGPDPWIAQDVASQFRQHLVLQNRICWVKSISIDGVTRGHQRPVNSTRFITRTNEEILHFTRTGAVPIDRLTIGVPYADKRNLDRWKGVAEDLRCGGNTWFVPYETVRNAAGKRHHPAAFPLELPRRCLKLHGRSGTVLDPFVGTGTTLVAARELGWCAMGVEIDETYAETARERVAEVLVG